MSATEPQSLFEYIKYYAAFIWRKYLKLPIFGKVLLFLIALFYACLGVFVIVVSPSLIAQYLYDHARMLAQYQFGWLVLSIAIVLISFPPLVGHTTLVTLCGFAYGMKGFLISFPASIVGAATSFVFLRIVFRERLRGWSAKNEKWQALEAVVREKGLPLIILIRISPFPPWVYSNSLFASIQPVALWQFVIATTFIAPKVLLHTFIGSKLASLSDGDQRSHMDTHTLILNSLFVGAGICIALFTSWWVYTLVQRHIKHLEGVPPEIDDLAAEAIAEYDEESPLLSSSDTQPGP
ncbi:Golgi apparatus membrane protein TVP38 [Pluteus cervinus]|uniref:Golgi apparatus membrane protein TVP38 n=1 Tax=Pluteus cervinus TaxID=181527 RepID=A0ACD3BEB9_9AGAR|nr:Golgi apparatus membrane protein TVP38 [Pluteus cervinus]